MRDASETMKSVFSRMYEVGLKERKKRIKEDPSVQINGSRLQRAKHVHFPPTMLIHHSRIKAELSNPYIIVKT